jgi:hypothetical protein
LTSIKKSLVYSQDYTEECGIDFGVNFEGCYHTYMDRLMRKIKDDLCLDSLNDKEKEFVDWLIDTRSCDDTEMFNELLSMSALEKKQARMNELWAYLNREN